MIEKIEGEYYISDNNSTNGTFIDGKKLLPGWRYILSHGNEVKIGNTIFEFTIQRLAEEDVDEETTAKVAAVVGEKFDTFVDYRDFGKKPIKKPREQTLSFRIDANRNISAISKILGVVSQSRDKRFLIEQSLNMLSETIKADRYLIFLLSPDGKIDIKAPYLSKVSNASLSATRGVSSGIMKKILGEGNPIWSTEVQADKELSKMDSLINCNIKSILASPIKARETILGIIYIDNAKGANRFTQEDIELITSVGLQLGVLIENIELLGEVQSLFTGIIRALINIIEAKDPYTWGHSDRVTKISLAIADELPTDKYQKETLHISALLHDIGKVYVSDSILHKPGRLTREEFEEVKKHPMVGAQFVEHIEKFDKVIEGIKHHHERFDGKGYPSGLAGEEIPLIARIIAIADSYDAMTSDRPYRKAMDETEAIKEIVANAGTQFDRKAVEAFVRAYRDGRICPRGKKKSN